MRSNQYEVKQLCNTNKILLHKLIIFTNGLNHDSMSSFSAILRSYPSLQLYLNGINEHCLNNHILQVNSQNSSLGESIRIYTAFDPPTGFGFTIDFFSFPEFHGKINANTEDYMALSYQVRHRRRNFDQICTDYTNFSKDYLFSCLTRLSTQLYPSSHNFSAILEYIIMSMVK